MVHDWSFTYVSLLLHSGSLDSRSLGRYHIRGIAQLALFVGVTDVLSYDLLVRRSQLIRLVYAVRSYQRLRPLEVTESLLAFLL